MGRWPFLKSVDPSACFAIRSPRRKLSSRRFARVPLASTSAVLFLLSTMHGAGVSLAVQLFRARSPLDATMLHWFTGQLLPFANELHFTVWTPFTTCQLSSCKGRVLFCFDHSSSVSNQQAFFLFFFSFFLKAEYWKVSRFDLIRGKRKEEKDYW